MESSLLRQWVLKIITAVGNLFPPKSQRDVDLSGVSNVLVMARGGIGDLLRLLTPLHLLRTRLPRASITLLVVSETPNAADAVALVPGGLADRIILPDTARGLGNLFKKILFS